MQVNLVILAAGQGTRMNSERPKVLHEIAGAPLVVHAMKSGAALNPERVVVVTGVGADEVARAVAGWDETAFCVKQTEQMGTGHAVLQAGDILADAPGETIVLYGDTPFIRLETLEAMLEARKDHAVVVLGFEAADPGRYGRLVTDGEILTRIVEFKEADAATKAITLCNSGVVAADTGVLMSLLAEVTNDNASGEYYLTDVVEIAARRGLTSTVVRCPEEETLGINTRAQLIDAEAAFQVRARAELIEDGVTLIAPETVHLAHDTVIGRDAVIEQNVIFGPGVTVESGARIRAFSHLEGCHVSRGAVVGPFARLRPGAELAEDVHIGNFVEIKNAIVEDGAKINHLTYLGDASVGAKSNIGAGTITCNYDGVNKHRTTIGRGVFVGSSTMLVAPVTLGDGAMTASGSVITEDVPPGGLGIARAKQTNKPGFAER
ncbi:MAG: bifunctional UDP-N-acetylglucosamine diphosphorylase/glucosamine-1-phosphate N-acetyltransferase GlmU, partial [Rubellimicrobium sp.]|nr:bifunctional UDP-N-acetylglucosamine diphosphorylase/glucosamine-1-phosphate N-acetyltransferase GlmU [Rubellimicrobium sp.]